MGLEIERKFLVSGEGWRDGAQAEALRQGYLPGGRVSVRVRVAGPRGFLTLKSAAAGLVRAEYEYEIPLRDAEALLDEFCEGPVLEKVRYSVLVHGRVWTVDVFAGDLEGLRLAEVELDTADQDVTLPPWIGREVTGDARYLNSSLARARALPEI